MRGVLARGLVGCDGAPFLVLITVLHSLVASLRLAAARSFLLLRTAANDKFEGAGAFLRELRGVSGDVGEL